MENGKDLRDRKDTQEQIANDNVIAANIHLPANAFDLGVKILSVIQEVDRG